MAAWFVFLPFLLLCSRPAQAASASPGQARRRCLEQPAIVYAGCGAVLSDLFIGSSEGNRGGTVQNSVAKPFGMTDLQRESAVGRRRDRLFQCGALSRPAPRAVKRGQPLSTHLRSSPPRFPSCLPSCLPICLSVCLPICLSVCLSLLPLTLLSLLWSWILTSLLGVLCLAFCVVLCFT